MPAQTDKLAGQEDDGNKVWQYCNECELELAGSEACRRGMKQGPLFMYGGQCEGHYKPFIVCQWAVRDSNE